MSVFVTDRTEYDVAVAQDFFRSFWGKLDETERATWMDGLKGCFNYTDFIRLAQITNGLLGTQDIPTNLSMASMPNKTNTELLFNGIKQCRDITYGLTERDFVDYRSSGADYNTSANKLDYIRLNYLEGGLELAEKFTNNNQVEMPIDFSLRFDDNEEPYLELDGILTATADSQWFNLYMLPGYDVKIIKGIRSHNTWVYSQETEYTTTTSGYGASFGSSTYELSRKLWSFGIEIRSNNKSVYDLDLSKLHVLLH